MRAAVASGALRPAAVPSDGGLFSYPSDAHADAPALLGVEEHRCVFFDDRGGHRCRVQDALGHDALPLACRQFPRVSVHDPRGVSVTLSAYCPTVAHSLSSTDLVTIVESPAAFPDDGEYEGLDARTSLPPPLSPNRLMDWESWWAWERLSVGLLANGGSSAGEALARLRGVVEEVRSWTPGDGPLIERVEETFARARHEPWVNASVAACVDGERIREVERAIPEELRQGQDHDQTHTPDHAVRRFLVSHAFANWTMHLGQGLRTWLRSIEAANALLESGLDVREADLRLRHLADPTALARAWTGAER